MERQNGEPGGTQGLVAHQLSESVHCCWGVFIHLISTPMSSPSRPPFTCCFIILMYTVVAHSSSCR